MAPKRSEKDGKKKETQPPSREWTHSKCSLNDLNKLVSEGLLQGNSPGPSVELTNTLPSVPQGRRVVRKRKAQEVKSSRYEYAA
jgi:hypothetical protein